MVCDASDFAIGCALMQYDADYAERVVYHHSLQLQPDERNFPVHDKELLAMKYALANLRVYLLGDRPFFVYTNYASLRTAVNSPHLSQQMASGCHSSRSIASPSSIIQDDLMSSLTHYRSCRFRTGCATRQWYNHCCITYL